MSIELRHLRYFIAVADELHFSRAAERLGISQPPLSQQIRDLERMLGVRLLRRTNRRVELTDAGTVYLDAARAILAQVEEASDLARRAERGEVGELRVAFTRSTPLTAMIPRAILAFRQAFPAVRLILEERNTLQQIEALLDGRQQVGILRPADLPDMLVSQRLFADPLVVVLRTDHPLLAGRTRRKLAMTDLAGEAFVVFASSAGTGIHRQFLSMCRHAGFSPRISQEAGEASTIIGLVSAGLGVAVLPSSLRHVQVEGVTYLPIASPEATSDVHVVHRRGDTSPLVAHFTRLLLAQRD
ncbi:LysR family transcriptional regulator [Luteibacter rhizovicinus]|uniref:LysR family transcriptional regulator n=1 Tax=Luteibacter rhizovicinus TaxID=242606 RepID=A0A4R3YTQ0_9GAMM|nr:LysR substrate-binding domain-containing protein [Luteibacter rhizovicinus]TCV94714.1 LysR family transcriptional regulator [Luteibacter rhizovicinus]